MNNQAKNKNFIAKLKPLDLPGTISEYQGYPMFDFQLDGCPCKIVVPKNPRPDRQFVWKAEFFIAFPKFELEMLNRGFYLVFIKVGNTFGCPDAMKHFDVFYQFMQKNGFAKRGIMLGLSRGGLYIYNWGAQNVDKVACLYGDNAVCDIKSWPGGKGCGIGSPADWQKLIQDYHFKDEAEAMAWRGNPVDNLDAIVKAGIPLIHTAGMDDDVVPPSENIDVLEPRAKALGANIKVYRHPGGHHPHGLEDPTELIEHLLKVALLH